jgi:hypothetical protein
VTDSIAVSQDRFDVAMADIERRVLDWFRRNLEDLAEEWRRLTGDAPSGAVRLALADLHLTFSRHEIQRAMRIVAYRAGFHPPVDDSGEARTAPITTWAVRQLLNEWRQDGRFGLEG